MAASEDGRLPEREGRVRTDACSARSGPERRKHHERDHGEEVLDDQPSDRDASRTRRRQPMLPERAKEHDRARHGHGDPEHQRRSRPERARKPDECPECRRDRDLHDRTGDGDPPHGQEVADAEMEADAEHQQHYADLSELESDSAVRHHAWRERTDQDPGHEVAHHVRQSRLTRQEAADEGGRDGDRDGRQELRSMLIHLANLRGRSSGRQEVVGGDRGHIVSGGGRESNPPGSFRPLTGFEDREAHQAPFRLRAEDSCGPVA
jgi:hypothetical protein